MQLGLRDKVVIVTGGASNIGRGIVLAFAAEGCKVVIADIDEARANRTADEARKLGAKGVLVVVTDVTRGDQVDSMVSNALRFFETVDVLVNNVGGFTRELFADKPREQIARDIDLNLGTTINCCHAVLPHMISAKSGSVVNISSGAGRQGFAWFSVCSAAKAGVIALTQSLAREVGGYGIRVNSVSPGRIPPTDTGVRPGRGMPAQELKDLLQHCCLRRTGTAEDIANAVVFLASDASGYITGQTLSVCGGQMFH